MILVAGWPGTVDAPDIVTHMPYYLHPTTEPLTDETLAAADPPLVEYPTRQAAHAARQPGQTVTYLESGMENTVWTARERSKFRTGKYLAVPWAPDHFGHGPNGEPWFLHMSTDRDGMIAYTESPEHGHLDKQTRMKPGRFLERFYKQHFSAAKIAYCIGACSAETRTLQIATTEADICAVYAGGPQSCMSGGLDGPKAQEYKWCRGPVAPVAVYADSDLAVAYYGPLTHVSARCVIWLAKKRYGRIYGEENTLRALLVRAGYEHSATMIGAHVRAISTDRGWLMPYVDGCETADLVTVGGRQMFKLTDDADSEYQTQRVDGVTNSPSEDEDEENHADAEIFYCNGEDGCDNEVDDQGDLCSACNENRWECFDCDEVFFDSTNRVSTFNVRHTLCTPCADTSRHTCPACDEDWYDLDLTYRDRQRRADDCPFCPDCDQTHALCAASDCDAVIVTADCPDGLCDACTPRDDQSNRIVRCEHTAPLPLEPAAVVAPTGGIFWQMAGAVGVLATRVWYLDTAGRSWWFTTTSGPDYPLSPSRFTAAGMDADDCCRRIADPRISVPVGVPVHV